MSGDNMNNVKRATRRHFKKKQRQYLKGKINEPATRSKNKFIRDLYRGINESKKGHRFRTDSVKREKDDVMQISAIF
jgi:hypothetical protein